ncbi:MAG TPA: isopentenyl phosphate kinase [Nitrososphaeraceae archaeon]|nr:isopentenyl phosphate kinase [Nitrososphaeraceae archaeon]HSF00889.1 isopentenyl phosphate kinase [Nitrososphaeraceae archaeon]
MNNNLVILKLGGSVITFKNKPLSANYKAIKNISKILKRLTTPLIIVHGGGSYGHYWSVKFDMHTEPAKYDPHGISTVHSSMLTLNIIIVDALEKEGLNPYGISPSSFLNNGKPYSNKIKELKKMTEHNIIPITYGDIVYIKNNKYSILSGDVLMTMISRILQPTKIIFALNVDGLYNNIIDKKIIKEINFDYEKKKQRVINFERDLTIKDVTGGIKRKVEEATKIARTGKDVIFLNGLDPIQIEKAVKDKQFKGTIFKGKI